MRTNTGDSIKLMSMKKVSMNAKSTGAFLSIFAVLFLFQFSAAAEHVGPLGKVKPGDSIVPSTEMPKAFSDIGITEKLGANIPEDFFVKNEAGVRVKLKDLVSQEIPTVFSLVYYRCTGLCNLHIEGFLDGVKESRWKVGKDFNVIALSFDPADTSESADMKRGFYLEKYKDDVFSNNDINLNNGEVSKNSEKVRDYTNSFRFLTADESDIKKITEYFGFKYKWLPEKNEWAHASAAILFSPAQKTTRYLHGVFFQGSTIDIGIGEAAQGKLGSVVDQIIWYCFKYDSHQSKYSIYATRIMQVGGVLVILLLMVILIPTWIRSRWGNEGAA